MAEFNTLFPDNRATGKTTLRQAQLVMLRMLKIIDYICVQHKLEYWLCSGTLLGAVRHKGFIPWDDDLDICMMRDDYEKFLTICQKELPIDLFLQTQETEASYDYLPLPCKIRDMKSLIISEGSQNKKYNQGLFIDVFPADRYHTKGFPLFIEKRIKNYFRFITKCLDAELGKDRSVKNKILYCFHPLFKVLTVSYKKHIKTLIKKNQTLSNDCLIGHGLDTPWRRYFKYSEIFPIRKIEFEDGMFMVPNNYVAYLMQLYGPDYMTPPPIAQQKQKHSILLKPIND